MIEAGDRLKSSPALGIGCHHADKADQPLPKQKRRERTGLWIFWLSAVLARLPSKIDNFRPTLAEQKDGYR